MVNLQTVAFYHSLTSPILLTLVPYRHVTASCYCMQFPGTCFKPAIQYLGLLLTHLLIKPLHTLWSKGLLLVLSGGILKLVPGTLPFTHDLRGFC